MTNLIKMKLIYGAGLITAVLAIIILAGNTYVINPIDSFSESPGDAQKLVNSAIELYDMRGEDAFPRIDVDPEFKGQELYVFVIRDSDGTIIADGGRERTLIGKNIDDIKDINGKDIGEIIHDRAAEDGIWVNYLWKDPANNQILPKQVWLVKHDGYIFGSGIYHKEN